jgi:hypothetical protein
MRLTTTRATRRAFALILLLIVPVIGADRVSAQEPGQSSAKKQERKKLDEMKQIARAFQVSVIDNQGHRTPATIAPEPLHRWTDPTREFSGGALWAWRSSGRPVAIYGIELYGQSWSHEFVSLSTVPLKADDGPVWWAPSKAGVKFHEVPDAPAPVADEAGRLRQMRDLARRFSAREFWAGRNYALRLLPHPIDRYSDPPSGLLDGTIFTYANGTNPELLLLIEARRQGDGPPRWWYAAARLARAELHLTLGQRDVWTAPLLDKDLILNPDETYYTRLTSRRQTDR